MAIVRRLRAPHRPDVKALQAMRHQGPREASSSPPIASKLMTSPPGIQSIAFENAKVDYTWAAPSR